MSLLILLVGVVGGFALVLELVLILGRDFLSGGREIESLKESIRKTQSELRGADKKLDALRANRRGAVKELESAVAKLEEMDSQARRAPDGPPTLVYVVGQPGAFGRRFRAKITKAFNSEVDENQALLWKHESVVEIVSDSTELARSEALRQFPEANGYTLAPFIEVVETTSSAA